MIEINEWTYMGFVRGRGCPRSVEAEYRAAYQRYEDALAERNGARKGKRLSALREPAARTADHRPRDGQG